MGDGELSDLVARAYAAAFDREQWQSYLEKLRDSTGASTAFLVSADLSGNSADGLDGPLIPDESNRLYRDHFHAIDEFALAYMRSGLGPGRTWSSHQLIPDARLAATEFYNGFLRRFDYFYTAGGILFQDGPSMIGLGVLRSRRQGPPDREALRLLTALMPHHQHTVRIAQRLRQLEAATRINDALADALPYGVIALDRHRRMTAMNGMAAEIVNARDGLCAGPAGLFALRARGSHAAKRDRRCAVPGRARQHRATAATAPPATAARRDHAGPARLAVERAGRSGRRRAAIRTRPDAPSDDAAAHAARAVRPVASAGALERLARIRREPCAVRRTTGDRARDRGQPSQGNLSQDRRAPAIELMRLLHSLPPGKPRA